MNYKLGKIYKIVSDQTNEIYVGSTCQIRLCNRLASHYSDYNRWLQGKGRYVSSFELIPYGDCRIILIESYPCNNRDELYAREQYWVDQIPNHCNKNRAYSSPEYKKEYMKEYMKEYHNENKEAIDKYTKEYYQSNKESILEDKKQKINCDYCDCKISKRDITKHNKTAKHIENLEYFEQF